jgi:FkbM family methyltransferase
MRKKMNFYSLSQTTKIASGYLELEHTLRKYQITQGVCVHAGGHKLQERNIYIGLNLSPRIWVEAIPELVLTAQKSMNLSVNDFVHQGALWSSKGVGLDFNLAKADYSSSILPMKLHRFIMGSGIKEVIRLKSTTLDDLMRENHSDIECIKLLVLDLQGVEFDVLLGASHVLEISEFVYTEVSLAELYRGQHKFTEINSLMIKNGFSLIDFEINRKYGDGNALYRNNKYHLPYDVEGNLVKLESGYRFLKPSFLYDWVILAAKFKIIGFLLFLRKSFRKLFGS